MQTKKKKIYQNELYGLKLARLVSAKLKLGFQLCFTHKEYCGIGLSFDKGWYYITRVYDGCPERRIPPIFKTDSEKQFIIFLSEQSDETMSGTVPESILFETDKWFRNNQRITRAILEEFIRDKL